MFLFQDAGGRGKGYVARDEDWLCVAVAERLELL